MFAPKFSDARMSWTKHAYLTGVVDDFFDVGGSLTELKNLIGLVEKGDVYINTDCCSEQVRIIFAELRNTILETGHKASILHGRCLYSMLKEGEWDKEISVPTLDEDMANAYLSLALGLIILPALYRVRPKSPDAVVRHSELCSLFKLVGTGGHLRNDIHGFQRELRQGKLNAISLRMIHDGITEADSIVEVKEIVAVFREKS